MLCIDATVVFAGRGKCAVPRPFRSADGPVRRLGDITELPPFAGERSANVARAAPAQPALYVTACGPDPHDSQTIG